MTKSPPKSPLKRTFCSSLSFRTRISFHRRRDCAASTQSRDGSKQHSGEAVVFILRALPAPSPERCASCAAFTIYELLTVGVEPLDVCLTAIDSRLDLCLDALRSPTSGAGLLLSMRSTSSVLLLLFVGSRVSIRLVKTTPRLCRVCKTYFDSESADQCLFHNGRFIGAENAKHHGTSCKENSGLSLFWDCCNAPDPASPGCVKGRHKSFDEDEIFSFLLNKNTIAK